MTFDERVLETVGRYAMLAQGDRIVVGFSGGADSVALLSFLYRHRKGLGVELAAAHLNHNLRGEESDRDQAFCEEFCRNLGIPLTVKSIDIAALAKSRGESVEVCARNERYAFFERERGEGKAATAHNATDNVETALLNLARGTSLRGLCGIPPVRGRIVRPLIRCPREQIEDYLREQGLSYVTDSTNLTEKYTRNRVRHGVLPVLREINPFLEARVAEMSELLWADDAFLQDAAAAALNDMRADERRFSRKAYLALPPAIASRALILLLKEYGLSYDKSRVEAIDRAVREGGPILQLPNLSGMSGKRGGGPRVVVGRDSFFIE